MSDGNIEEEAGGLLLGHAREEEVGGVGAVGDYY